MFPTLVLRSAADCGVRVVTKRDVSAGSTNLNGLNLDSDRWRNRAPATDGEGAHPSFSLSLSAPMEAARAFFLKAGEVNHSRVPRKVNLDGNEQTDCMYESGLNIPRLLSLQLRHAGNGTPSRSCCAASPRLLSARANRFPLNCESLRRKSTIDSPQATTDHPSLPS
jgi:hypothetical protein